MASEDKDVAAANGASTEVSQRSNRRYRTSLTYVLIGAHHQCFASAILLVSELFMIVVSTLLFMMTTVSRVHWSASQNLLLRNSILSLLQSQLALEITLSGGFALETFSTSRLSWHHLAVLSLYHSCQELLSISPAFHSDSLVLDVLDFITFHGSQTLVASTKWTTEGPSSLIFRVMSSTLRLPWCSSRRMISIVRFFTTRLLCQCCATVDGGFIICISLEQQWTISLTQNTCTQRFSGLEFCPLYTLVHILTTTIHNVIIKDKC